MMATTAIAARVKSIADFTLEHLEQSGGPDYMAMVAAPGREDAGALLS